MQAFCSEQYAARQSRVDVNGHFEWRMKQDSGCRIAPIYAMCASFEYSLDHKNLSKADVSLQHADYEVERLILEPAIF